MPTPCLDATVATFSVSRRPERYRAPTWYWASIDGPVRYLYHDDQDDGLRDEWLAEARCHVELVHAGNPFGTIRAARLVLHGPLIETKIRWFHQVLVVTYLDNSKAVLFAELRWDTQQDCRDLADGSTVWCLALHVRGDIYMADAIMLLQYQEKPSGVRSRWAS